MKELSLKAMAKINLGLDVLRRRPDGYHELRMVMQTVKLHDCLELRQAGGPGIRVTTNRDDLPAGPDNLVWKAANLLMEEFCISDGLEISLRKNIPVAAGLAGGSSDAAAVMAGVNRMFGLGLTERELMERGVKIGADVPYCIMRGTALAEGIGERLTRLPDAPEAWVLLAKPGVSVPTKFVYSNLHLDQVERHPDIDAQVQAVRDGDLYRMAECMGNVLESVTIPAYPVILEIREQMKQLGALNAMMSGSGPTVFGLFDDKEKAERACAALTAGALAQEVFLTEFFRNESAGGWQDNI